MEPKEYERLMDAANDIKVSRETLIYAYENRRSFITRRKGGVKVFCIEWLDTKYLSSDFQKSCFES